MPAQKLEQTTSQIMRNSYCDSNEKLKQQTNSRSSRAHLHNRYRVLMFAGELGAPIRYTTEGECLVCVC